jgi:nucleoside-diphosphate-sugar epimerase
LRLFFIYGPRQFVGLGYPSVIVRTFDRILRGQAPTLYGDGQQSLDYVYVDDAVEAIVRAADTPHVGEVFNVASGTAVKVADLLQTLSDIAGYSGAPKPEPPDWTANSCRVGDPTKASELLDWKTTTSLRDGLTRTFEWSRGALMGEKR